MSYNYLFKFILVGDSLVGKSAILNRFTNNIFNIEIPITIGVDFGSNIIEVDNKQIKLQIWDTAGQEKFNSIVKSYYRGVVGCLLVFDLTNYNSFKNIKEKWFDEIKNYGNKNIIITLVGNKSDNISKRKVSSHEAQEFALKNNINYMETSAYLNKNINEIFSLTSFRILSEVRKGNFEIGRENGICLGESKSTFIYESSKKKKCCF